MVRGAEGALTVDFINPVIHPRVETIDGDGHMHALTCFVIAHEDDERHACDTFDRAPVAKRKAVRVEFVHLLRQVSGFFGPRVFINVRI